MSTPVTIGGLTYYIPALGESNWGQNVSDALVAIASNISGGGFFSQIVTVTSSPITVVSARTYLVDTTAARTLNLPAPAVGAYLLVVDKTGTAQTNNITIHRSAGEKIDGTAADKTIATYKGQYWFVSDGTDWFSIVNGPAPVASPVFTGDVVIPATKKIRLDGSPTGDTYIQETSANQVDIYTNNSLALQMAAAIVAVGGTRDLQIAPTKRIYLDGGDNTYISEASADRLLMTVGGNSVLDLRSNFILCGYDLVLPATGKLRLDGSSGGDTYILESSANTLATFAGGVQVTEQTGIGGGAGNNSRLYAYGEVNAANYVDRTPYPKDKQEAYDSILSIEQKSDKSGVDHNSLHPFIKSTMMKKNLEGEDVAIIGRDLSATVSAQNEVIKDLIEKIEEQQLIVEDLLGRVMAFEKQ